MINTFRTLFEARERKFQQERLFRGESVDLVAKITTDGVLDTLSGYSISGVYQPTDDLSGDIYSVDAEIVDGNAVLHWTDENDFGKDSYNVWGLLTKDGKAAYPICWRLMFAHSPSYPLNTPDPIPRTIDFSQYELLNAPWLPLSGGTLSGRIYYDIEEPVQITNLSSWIGDATGLGRGIITIYNETENTLDDKYSQEGATLSGRWDNMWNPPNPTGPLVFPENPQEGDTFDPYAAMDGEYLNGKDVTFSKGTVLIANPGWETKEVPCFKIHVVYSYIYHVGEGWTVKTENDWCICKINGEWQAASFARGFTAYDSLVWHEFSEGGTEPREPDPFVLSSEIANFATKQYVQESIASIPTPELADFATYEYVNGKFETQEDARIAHTQLMDEISKKIDRDEVSSVLSDYATESFVNDSFNNARFYTDEQIDQLSDVYVKKDDIDFLSTDWAGLPDMNQVSLFDIAHRLNFCIQAISGKEIPRGNAPSDTTYTYVEMEDGTILSASSVDLSDIQEGTMNAYVQQQGYSGSNKIKGIVLGAGVTNIGHHAFAGFEKLESVDISRATSLTLVEDRTFQYDPMLSFVDLGTTITTIGATVFQHSYNLKTLTIPASMTSANIWSFNNGGIETMVFTDRTKAEVQAMSSYPWQMGGCLMVATDESWTA